MAIAIALPGFNDRGRSVTPIFLFRNGFYLHLSPHCPKMNKKSMWELKSVSMSKPGRTRQEVIQLKSPIWLKLGINVGFAE